MAKFVAILLALSLAAGGALAASPEADHLAARDKYIAEIKALENSKASESSIQAAEDKAAADLEKRLKNIVGPLAVKSFPPADKLNLALSDHEEEFGNLDGLTSYSEGQDMVVTTKPLLRAWVEAKAEEKGQRRPPASRRRGRDPSGQLLHLFRGAGRRLREERRFAGDEAGRLPLSPSLRSEYSRRRRATGCRMRSSPPS